MEGNKKSIKVTMNNTKLKKISQSFIKHQTKQIHSILFSSLINVYESMCQTKSHTHTHS